MEAACERAREGLQEFFQEMEVSKLQELCRRRDEDGRTLLHHAATSGNAGLVRLLSEQSSANALNSADEEGWTPLHSAVSAGHERLAELLMEMGANTRIRNSGGRAPCHYAASKGHVGILRKLLQHGAEVEVRDSTGSTPLHRAASAGKQEAVQFLVEKAGAALEAADVQGCTPLFVALEAGHNGVAVFLASKGAKLQSPTKAGDTPLSLCSTALALQLQQAADGTMNLD